TRARRLLREVHTLARAYGWREAEILALPGRRRQTYLDLVGA
ncbi:MAG TPA: phage baseplate protein, partial [Chloroflexota bacterium]|nr:phage baseplate protein [Chloroflexota bacterium]